MEIFWIKDKQRRGPASVPDVMDLIHRGDLQPDTLGWHAGVQGWKPLRELPALADFLREEEDKADEAPHADTPAPVVEPGLPPKPSPDPVIAAKLNISLPARLEGEFSGNVTLPTAGVRLLARAVDTLLYLALALGVLYLSGAPYNQYYLPGSPVFWLPMILLEALCLSKWNSTPGKRLLGIYICTLGEHTAMSFGRAFMRSFMVYILGVGMMSFPFFPIMLGISYWTLRSRGICWWDMRTLTFPIAKKQKGIARVLSALALLYVCLVAAGVFIKPWLKPMYDEIYKADPDTARLMLRFAPELQQHLPEESSVPQPLK